MEYSLGLVDNIPAFIDENDIVYKTTAPQLFDTGGGMYIAYANGWEEELDKLFPNGWQEKAEAVKDEFQLTITNEPSIWLLVAITLED